WPRDWSSDVCSSDLAVLVEEARHLALPVVGLVRCLESATTHRLAFAGGGIEHLAEAGRDRSDIRRVDEDPAARLADDGRHPREVAGDDWHAGRNGLEELGGR